MANGKDIGSTIAALIITAIVWIVSLAAVGFVIYLLVRPT